MICSQTIQKTKSDGYSYARRLSTKKKLLDLNEKKLTILSSVIDDIRNIFEYTQVESSCSYLNTIVFAPIIRQSRTVLTFEEKPVKKIDERKSPDESASTFNCLKTTTSSFSIRMVQKYCKSKHTCSALGELAEINIGANMAASSSLDEAPFLTRHIK